MKQKTLLLGFIILLFTFFSCSPDLIATLEQWAEDGFIEN